MKGNEDISQRNYNEISEQFCNIQIETMNL